MTTQVDIANLALAHLGDKASVSSIDPPEGSPQAEHCARFYPIARDLLLEQHDWKFAVTRITLPSLQATNPPPSPWLYSYGVPADYISLTGVYEPDATNDDEMQEYISELAEDGVTQVIFTNVENAVLRYKLRVIDVSRYPPQFVVALSYILASYLAGPVIKGDASLTVADGHMKFGLAVAAKAAMSDARQQRVNTYRDDSRNAAPWLGGRGPTIGYNDRFFRDG